MSDIAFNPVMSTNEIFRGNNRSQFLTNDLDAIEADIQALETGKADSDHTHTGYAAANHTHSDYASADHIHSTKNVAKANEDLNDYTVAGVYSFAASYQPVNRPEGTSNGWLVVIPWTSNPTTGTVKQFWLRHGTLDTNDHCIYVRTKIGDYGWGDWSRVITDNELKLVTEVGDVYLIWTGQDVVAKFSALAPGMYTAYSKGGTSSGVTNAPNANEGWRYICHKTSGNGSPNYGWILAFGTGGSVYAGYLDVGTWKGWRCLTNASSNVLWSGASYLKAEQTITPSKKLSECRTGWILLWSDYDESSTTANDADFCTTMIPKFRPNGTNWDGKMFLCDIPRFYGSDTSNPDTEKRIMKAIYIHDNKIVGHTINNLATRTDVVLRAVYEF